MKLVRPALSMPGPRIVVAVLTADLACEATAAATVKRWDGDSWESSDEEITVTGPPGIDWGEDDLPSGAWILAAKVDGIWIVINAACPEPEE